MVASGVRDAACRCGVVKFMPQPPTLPRKNIRLLALAGAGFFGFSSIWLLIALRFSQTGWDFTQFYIAAHLPVQSLYDHAAFVAFGEHFLASIGVKYYPPFVRPAVFSMALKPLALFPYWPAFWLWATVGLAAYLTALLILFRKLDLPKNILPWFALFYPAMSGIMTGQDCDVYLLVLVAALMFIVSGKEIAGGCVLALCTYKFNLILFLPIVLLAKTRWKAFFSFAVLSGAAGLASAALVPPAKYFTLLRAIPEITIGFIPGGLRGVTIRLGHPAWYYPIALVGSLLCIYLIWKLPLVESFCVGVTGALMLAYHVTWYDCALLVLPICVAWTGSGKKMRAALLTMLALPFAWLLGNDYCQVIAEILILAYFSWIAFRQPVVAQSVASALEA